MQEIIKLLGHEDILSAADVPLPDWGSKPGMLGFPATRIDVKLAPQYLGKVWRENGTCARVKHLSVIHLAFRLNAGVEDGSPKLDKRPGLKPGDYSVAKALKINRWPGWECKVAEYSMTTDGKQCGYRRRSWYGYCARRRRRLVRVLGILRRAAEPAGDHVPACRRGPGHDAVPRQPGRREKARGLRFLA